MIISPVLVIVGFLSASAFIVSFCAVILVFRSRDILMASYDAVDLLTEIAKLERRKIWVDDNPKAREPREKPMPNGHMNDPFAPRDE